MLKILERFLDARVLELNTNKTKMMVFRKGGRRGKQEAWMWKGEEIEEVKTFKYLGYTFQENGGTTEHIRGVQKKRGQQLKVYGELAKEDLKEIFELVR